MLYFQDIEEINVHTMILNRDHLLGRFSGNIAWLWPYWTPLD